jgi:hypothetical protein
VSYVSHHNAMAYDTATNYRLIVVSYIQTAANQGQGPIPLSIFWCIFIQHPNQGNQLQQVQTHRQAPAIDLWGAAAPWFGAMADVAMEI